LQSGWVLSGRKPATGSLLSYRLNAAYDESGATNNNILHKAIRPNLGRFSLAIMALDHAVILLKMRSVVAVLMIFVILVIAEPW